MPKASKKRKEKAADFAKAKLKLGKGKAQANNAVDTSFKARSITLPSQSITAQKDEAVPRNSRKLTFDDLMAQLKHHNANTRKDAILGVRELLDKHADLIESHLAVLLNICARLISDEDASARKALLGFFDWLLPKVTPELLGPHASHLLLFTTSAQTHIFPEIRIDAVRFLDLLLDIIPDHVVMGWDGNRADVVTSHGFRVLEGYLGILNAGTKFGQGGPASGPVEATSTASVMLSSPSKQAVLKSLAHFLETAISATRSNHAIESYTAFLSTAFLTKEAYKSFDSLLRPSTQGGLQTTECTWTRDFEDDKEATGWCHTGFVDAAGTTICFSLQDICVAANYVEAADRLALENDSMMFDHVAHIAKVLHPTLLSTILDCAPLVFSINKGGPPEAELNLVAYIGHITRILYGFLLQDQSSSLKRTGSQQACEDLQQILGYLAPYFPFKEENIIISKPNIKVQQKFQKLNLIFCEMTAMLLQTTRSGQLAESLSVSESFRRRGKQKATQNDLIGSLVDPVCKYVIQILQGVPLSSNSLGGPVTPEVYTSLLQTIWSLLNLRDVDEHYDPHGSSARAILLAVLDHALKPTAAARRVTIEFVGRLLLLQSMPDYRGDFFLGRSDDEVQRVEEWITQLPRVLWELRSSNLPSSEIILRLLLRLLQRRSGFLQAKVMLSLCSRLIPYFAVTHPSKGEISGPFQDLPPSSQNVARRLALDVAATIVNFLPSGRNEGGKLEVAVSKAVANSVDEAYWIQTRTTITLLRPLQKTVRTLVNQ